MPRLGLALVVAGLCLAPLGSSAFAQSADLAKVCNDLRDPFYFPIDPTTQRLALPPGLDEGGRVALFVALVHRFEALQYLRRIEVAQEAEASLNLLELTLDNPSANAKAALEQVRAGLQNDANLYRDKARRAKELADEAFKRLCEGIQPPATITLQPIPGLLPGLGVVGAPLPPASVTTSTGGVRFVLVATTPTPSNPSLTVTDGRVFTDGGYYEVETTWTKPPESFGPEGFSLTLGCRVQPPAGQGIASGVDLRGGLEFDPSPASFECNAQDGVELKLSRQVAIKPLPSQTTGELFLQIGQFYSGGVTYSYRAEE
jgi:hypothetical protein